MPNQNTISSKLTSRYQTTIPAPIRKSLGLQKHDRIQYRVLDSGEVLLSRALETQSDPALAPFLALLEQNIARHAETLRPLDAQAITRAQELTDGMEAVLWEGEQLGDVANC